MFSAIVFGGILGMSTLEIGFWWAALICIGAVFFFTIKDMIFKRNIFGVESAFGIYRNDPRMSWLPLSVIAFRWIRNSMIFDTLFCYASFLLFRFLKSVLF